MYLSVCISDGSFSKPHFAFEGEWNRAVVQVNKKNQTSNQTKAQTPNATKGVISCICLLRTYNFYDFVFCLAVSRVYEHREASAAPQLNPPLARKLNFF